MKTFRVCLTHQMILDSLSNQESIRKIARSLSKSPSTIYRDIKKLEQYGYITRALRSTQSFYNINPSGMEILKRYWNGEQKTLTGYLIDATPREKLQIRLHRLQIKYHLLNPISDPSVIQFSDYPSEFVKMNNWTKNIISFQDFTVILSTRSIIITGLQLESDILEDVEMTEANILASIQPIVQSIEEKIHRFNPHFKLKRLANNVLSGHIISREWAYEHHPIAESVGHMEIRDPDDNKPRVIVDQSKGFPELETVHKDYSTQDMELLRKNTWAMSQTDFSQQFNNIDSSVQTISTTVETLKRAYDQEFKDTRKEFNYQVSTVMDVLQNMAVRMQELVKR